MPGMSFELSEDHEQFRRTVRDFAEKEIAPHAAQWDHDHHFPVDVIQKMGQLGLFGLNAPEQYGGADGDFTSLCVAIEELGRVDQSMGITLEAAVGLGINPILTFGTDEQKDTWLPDLVEGTDAGRLRPHRAGRRLRRRGHEDQGRAARRRVGRQRQQAVHHQLRVRDHQPGHRHRDDRRAGGRAPRGLHDDRAQRHARVHRGEGLRQARLARLGHPPAQLQRRAGPGVEPAGRARRGFAQFLAILDDGRVAIAALAVGCIQACLDMSVQYAGERTTFGVPIGRKQGVAFQIADLEVMLAASRQLTYRAAWMKDAGKPMKDFKHAAAIAKLYATESAVTATRIATQVFGGYGFMEEYPVARFYRDAKVLEIGEGTSEVQRMLIARGLGLPVE